MSELLVVLILGFVFDVECTPRDFSHPEMCKLGSPDGSTDCSFQMGDQRGGTCTVYNSAECRNFEFSGWMKQSSSRHPAAQSDSIFAVDVKPYAYTSRVYQRQIFPAVNVTLATSDEGVDGYILQVADYQNKKNICRIFDFRNSSARNNAIFFYDCLLIRNENVRGFNLTVRALPHNEEMEYALSLPDAESTETRDSSRWEPLIMVFKGSLQNNIVEVKFSQALQHLNISSYEVSVLPDKSDVPVQQITVEATGGDALLSATFSRIDRGLYFICIRPFSSTSSQHCHTARYTVFIVENKLMETITIIWITVVCIIGIVMIIAVLLWLRWLFKPGSITTKPVALLVYSYDCKEHDIAVLRFAKFLENRAGIKVLTIYGEQRSDPEMWLFNPYRNCDIVMVILSEGVFYKCENGNNPAMKEGYPCGDRLIPALNFLKTKILCNEKRFIQVYFEYSGTCQVPSFMQSMKWGEAFVISREMNRLLCHVYNQSPKIACFGIYPRMPGHDVISYPEGLSLTDSIEEMKQVLLKNHSVLHINDVTSNTEFSRGGHTPPADEDSCTDCGVFVPQSGHVGNRPSKTLYPSYYNNECMPDEESCARLLSDNSVPQSVAECNTTPNVLHDTKEMCADQHLKDLDYIFSKPGPSFYLGSLKLSK